MIETGARERAKRLQYKGNKSQNGDSMLTQIWLLLQVQPTGRGVGRALHGFLITAMGFIMSKGDYADYLQSGQDVRLRAFYS